MISSTLAVLSTLPALPIPNPGPEAPPGFDEFTGTIISWMKWILIALGVGGILYAAGQVVVGGRNRQQLAVDGLVRAGTTLAGLALGSVAFILVGMFI